MGDRVGLADLPAEEVALLVAIGSSRPGAIKKAVEMDAIRFAVDVRRHVSTQRPPAILDTRLKEMRRR